MREERYKRCLGCKKDKLIKYFKMDNGMIHLFYCKSCREERRYG